MNSKNESVTTQWVQFNNAEDTIMPPTKDGKKVVVVFNTIHIKDYEPLVFLFQEEDRESCPGHLNGSR